MRALLICIVLITTQVLTFGQTTRKDTSAKAGEPLIMGATRPAYRGNLKPVRVELSAGWTFGIDADAFFKDYQVVLGGKASGFDAPVGFGLSMSSYQLGNASIGVSAGYYRAVVRENYDYKPRLSDTSFGPPQNITQNISLTCIPAVLTIDYYPFARQFTGYVGAGVGLGAATFVWTEEITSSQVIGARTSGERYNDTHLVPAFSVRSGISLGLDDELGANIRAALTIEGAYLYMPLTAPLFAATANSFVAPTPARLKGDYKIQTGGFQLRIGFSIFIRPPPKTDGK
ncbi:MAG: hypothetical protein NTX15_03995 [Candidatus Kapabacteria bacterium]|nr:hypothetical protein [Candidatus Kapabacteria bacterium]